MALNVVIGVLHAVAVAQNVGQGDATGAAVALEEDADGLSREARGDDGRDGSGVRVTERTLGVERTRCGLRALVGHRCGGTLKGGRLDEIPLRGVHRLPLRGRSGRAGKRHFGAVGGVESRCRGANLGGI